MMLSNDKFQIGQQRRPRLPTAVSPNWVALTGSALSSVDSILLVFVDGIVIDQ